VPSLSLLRADGGLAFSPRRWHVAANMPRQDQARATAWSLEHRLPILISLLLACVVGGLSLAAYREVRATAVERAKGVLERVQHELIAGAARPNAARVETLRSLAEDSLIVRALAGGVRAAAVEARLAAAREANDSTLVAWQIASLSGQPRFGSPGGWRAIDSAEFSTTLSKVVETGATQRAPFYAVGEGVHVWLVVPVLADGRVVGSIAELRRVGDNYGADAVIRALVDDEARMLFTSVGSNQWVSLRGRPVAAPFERPRVEDRAVRIDVGGRGMYAVQSLVPGTPFLVVLFQPESSVLRRPQDFLFRLLGAGVVVLALATIGAWFLSKPVGSRCRAEGERWRASRRHSTRWPNPPARRTPSSPSATPSSSARTRRRRSSSP
jgi:hypothetical protein